MLTRDSDRYWYETAEAGFNEKDLNEINHTTLSQIIARNTPNTYTLPSNIWFVQPSTNLKSTAENSNNPFVSPDYPQLNHLSLSDTYEMFWKVIGNEIYFKLVVSSSI